MSVLAFLDTGESSPPELYTARGALAIVGAGTFVFHAFPLDATDTYVINVRACDWLPIVLMLLVLVLVYAREIPRSSLLSPVLYTAIFGWATGLILVVDSQTRPQLRDDLHDNSLLSMNFALLLPVFLILARLTVLVYAKPHLLVHCTPMFVLAGASALAWALNVALCPVAPILAVLHAMYHLTVALTFLHAACWGVALTDDALVVVTWAGGLLPALAPYALVPASKRKVTWSTMNGI